MNELQASLERSLRNPYPTDAQVNRLGLGADESYPYRLVPSVALIALLKAKEVREAFSASYRSFKVGVSVLAYSTSTRNWSVFGGANVKVDSTDLINVHAEDTALGKALDGGYDLVPLVVLVGDLQDDQQSGRQIATLHPCGRCRDRFLTLPVITDRTLFMTATPDLSVVQIYTLAELRDFHSGERSDLITETLEDDLANWDTAIAPHLIAHCLDVVRTYTVS